MHATRVERLERLERLEHNVACGSNVQAVPKFEVDVL